MTQTRKAKESDTKGDTWRWRERSQPGKGSGRHQGWGRRLRKQCAHDVVQQGQHGVGARKRGRRV